MFINCVKNIITSNVKKKVKKINDDTKFTFNKCDASVSGKLVNEFKSIRTYSKY